jgi:hypothetical protein
MKKLTKSHTTFLDTKVAETILDFLSKNRNVKSFTAGMIVPKRPPSRSEGVTKIVVTSNSLQININSKRSKQEIRVYGNGLKNIADELVKQLILNKYLVKVVLRDVEKKFKLVVNEVYLK